MENDESRRHETMSSRADDELIARKLASKINAHGVGGYIHEVNNAQKGTRSTAAIHEVAKYVIPIDPVLGPELSHPGNNQFMIGGLIGIDIAHEQLGKYIDHELARNIVTLFEDMANETDGRDELDRYHNITEALLSAGQQQWLECKAYYEITESVEVSICPEIAHQSYLEAGMGVVLLAVERIRRRREAERYEKDRQQFIDSLQGIHDFDWDNAPWDR